MVHSAWAKYILLSSCLAALWRRKCLKIIKGFDFSSPFIFKFLYTLFVPLAFYFWAWFTAFFPARVDLRRCMVPPFCVFKDIPIYCCNIWLPFISHPMMNALFPFLCRTLGFCCFVDVGSFLIFVRVLSEIQGGRDLGYPVFPIPILQSCSCSQVSNRP